MVFTHTDPAPPPMVEHAVAVAPAPSLPSPASGGGWGGGSGRRKGGGGRRRQRLRVSLTATLEVQTLISKVGKNERPADRQPRRSAIFVHARADVEAGRRNVSGNTVRTSAHDHVAALLLRAPFEPIDMIPVDAN